jgi:hypothetical protein
MDTDGKEDKNGAGIDIEYLHATNSHGSWNGDLALTRTMIAIIEDDEDLEMCQSLFPPPDGVKCKGGHPKTHYHWVLAQLLFAKHPNYMEAFKKRLGKPKHKAAWSDKVKN